MTTPIQIAIIGGGPAGITAAIEAAHAGAQVTLISDGPVGGRAGWASLLPSKVLLHAAEEHADPAARFPAADIQALTAHIKLVAAAFNGQEADRLTAAGVTVITGKAQFSSPHSLTVTTAEGSHELAFDSAIIASGSVPIFPPDVKPDGKRIIAPRFVSHLSDLADSMLVIGGGVTGTEFVYALSALGIRVTWLVNQSGVLPDFDRSLARALTDSLLAQGVTLVEGTATASLQATETEVIATRADGRTFRAEKAFLAIGRRPDAAGLNLDAAGLSATANGLAVDAFARTAVPHIFAAGDITGPPLIANKAQAQAWIAGRTAAGITALPPKPAAWIEAAFSHPQVAQVGLTPDRAAAQGIAVHSRTVSYTQALKPYLTEPGLDGPGFVTLITDPESNRVLGGLAFGYHAAEVLAPIALAVQADLSADHVAALFPAYPSLSELAFMAAR